MPAYFWTQVRSARNSIQAERRRIDRAGDLVGGAPEAGDGLGGEGQYEISPSRITVIAWFVILFTGSYPQSTLPFALGVMRWTLRVEAYLLLLVDEYPPFALE